MNQFEYVRLSDVTGAAKAISKVANSQFLAGGTNLIDLIKMGITTPARLVDIKPLPLAMISRTAGGITIGAIASNSQVAEHADIKSMFPLLAMAINAGASPQLRNMATTGGNLMQRTRCPYFFDITMPCNKRAPGTGCGALEGINRMHAILGASDKCIAVNPSDMNVALAALDATIEVTGAKGKRVIRIADFHRLPGDHPELDNTLAKGELITSVTIPASPFNKNYHYLKVRDRTSYAFALVSAAVGLQMDGNTIRAARIAMGGVAHKPWRATAAEKFLQGKTATDENFEKAGQLAIEGAHGYEHNKFKLKLAPNAVRQALLTAAAKK
ncbi:MAG: xanthine dehydrogenase family protein subunit M [Chitinophagaceae bacterium]|nr:MAG: xanthine dehydrogenase family protein subunit M [Chitinophagaceae bacterium]